MRVLCVSVTDRGRRLAEGLPYEHVHGKPAEAVRSAWDRVDGIVLLLASGAATRIVAPLLSSKETDPAVVCVDESVRWAVSLCGGHSAGANRLAEEVASLTGATPVVTTATDALGVTALDVLDGFVARGDTAAVTRAMLDGRRPLVESRLGRWPLPEGLESGEGPERIVVTDHVTEAGQQGVALLHPRSLVVGIGCSSGATLEDANVLLRVALEQAGLAQESIDEVATITSRAGHRAVAGLGFDVRSFSADELALVRVPNPSTQVADAVGTASVAEASCLLAAGDAGELAVGKQKGKNVTVAVARRSSPRGEVVLVGLGPGDPRQRTVAAATAVRRAQTLIGYGPYLEQASDLLCGDQRVLRFPIGEEVARARTALEEASAGRRVALVCSGDPGIYAMASVVMELASSEGDKPGAPPGHIRISMVPGVTAALSAASLLGAPLGHDHAVVSLSDLLTPWSEIERRLNAAAEADLVLALYNPRSSNRSWQLEAAVAILSRHRAPDTPVGVVTDAYRPEQAVICTTLSKLDPSTVGMRSCVIVGSSTTRLAGGRMFTPRGYST